MLIAPAMLLIMTYIFILVTVVRFLKMTIALISKLGCTNVPRNMKSYGNDGQYSHVTPTAFGKRSPNIPLINAQPRNKCQAITYPPSFHMVPRGHQPSVPHSDVKTLSNISAKMGTLSQ